MDDKDRLIEELQRKLSHVTQALRTIDADVAGAAKKYLRRNDGGFLDFSEFLDLLVLEVKEQIREKHSNQVVLREKLKDVVRERLEQEVASLVPALKGRLSQYLTIQVVILERRHTIKDHLLVKSDPFFRALSVRGEGIPGSVGATPEEAYQDQKKRLACHFFSGGPDLTASLLSPRNWELAKQFDAAQPFMTDALEDFKVEVRLLKKEPKP